MIRRGDVGVRRIYEQRSPSDGCRILVDRVWPRGLTRAAADIDEWCRDVAPSTELRRWYAHSPAKFEEFRARYEVELDDVAHRPAMAHLRAITRHDELTLLTAVKELALSHARILAQRLSSSPTTDQPAIPAIPATPPKERS